MAGTVLLGLKRSGGGLLSLPAEPKVGFSLTRAALDEVARYSFESFRSRLIIVRDAQLITPADGRQRRRRGKISKGARSWSKNWADVALSALAYKACTAAVCEASVLCLTVPLAYPTNFHQ